ncbi:RdgB/HAM1 family non-canonical purine NTP pyrophosphatase [Deinococcus sp.]|uniref:RdgB/HAM1 family non-canonical purine NTP pyrophosphatase n=1 Tax=Deinococcus sp. TaxID=47478 RepID=UPI003CC5265B
MEQREVRRVVLATSNAGKVREIAPSLAGLDWELLALNDPRLPALTLPEETGASYEENAALKACAVSLHTGLPALADDSGLEVAALHGAPGIYSARFGNRDGVNLPNDLERNLYLLERLRGQTDRRARFVSVVVLAFPDGRFEEYRGEVEGELLEGPRGQGGFGYDPLFLLPGGRTMSELTLDEKRAVSHRGRALDALRAAYASARLTPQ